MVGNCPSFTFILFYTTLNKFTLTEDGRFKTVYITNMYFGKVHNCLGFHLLRNLLKNNEPQL